jgi:GTPase KRas protein
MIDDEMTELEVLDTAGTKEYEQVKEGKMKERDGFLLVFDLSNKSTLDRVDEFYQ